MSDNKDKPLSNCRGRCHYDSHLDICHTCGRTMEQIRNAYSASNSKVRM